MHTPVLCICLVTSSTRATVQGAPTPQPHPAPSPTAPRSRLQQHIPYRNTPGISKKQPAGAAKPGWGASTAKMRESWAPRPSLTTRGRPWATARSRSGWARCAPPAAAAAAAAAAVAVPPVPPSLCGFCGAPRAAACTARPAGLHWKLLRLPPLADARGGAWLPLLACRCCWGSALPPRVCRCRCCRQLLVHACACACAPAPPQDPVCTPKGFLFSREAILENLLEQKKANKRRLAAWDAQQADHARKEVRAAGDGCRGSGMAPCRQGSGGGSPGGAPLPRRRAVRQLRAPHPLHACAAQRPPPTPCPRLLPSFRPRRTRRPSMQRPRCWPLTGKTIWVPARRWPRSWWTQSAKRQRCV